MESTTSSYFVSRDLLRVLIEAWDEMDVQGQGSLSTDQLRGLMAEIQPALTTQAAADDFIQRMGLNDVGRAELANFIAVVSCQSQLASATHVRCVAQLVSDPDWVACGDVLMHRAAKREAEVRVCIPWYGMQE